MAWRGNIYVDRALPFGLRSAPKISVSAIADFIAWVLACEGVRHQLHYLDDFLFIGPPNSPQGHKVLSLTLQTFEKVGIPIATHKTEGPATTLVFLGILINTDNFELRLPADKLLRLQQALQQWVTRRTCMRRELESLLGHLSHAAIVIPQGHVFLRLLFALLSLNSAPHHFLRLNAGATADLMWWKFFLHSLSRMAGFSCSGRRAGMILTLQQKS